ncbi:endo-1,4-beta-xylanase [Rhabdobacter roseus]|uniref:Beta-xylanase n=1 Tax=Rhabdobacter roseus TaxID=1655419 RepID=A0A840TH73_9BACT|nr:endo-1,4-beta-xylanase [Rhabdobacter roseus]MBB5282601.1 GH35 family endo-1,4-beta-xylanase [Rhabdobacter roseus]
MKKILLLLLLLQRVGFAQTHALDSLWAQPEVEKRIQEGIEAHRKGEFTLHFPDAKGTFQIEVKQVKHAFLFGSNIFMLHGFKTPAQNQRYETVFKELFNLACVPFYWKTLEPQQGKLRYEAGSPEIYRRPPPDVVLDFCRKNGITPKGHTLVWDNATHAVPDWLPRDTSKIQPLIDQRIKQLAERYGETVKTWDVVNEVLKDHPAIPMPPEYPLKAFHTAQRHFPAETRLFLNEVTTESWQNYHREYTPFNLLISHLKHKGARIDGLGLQFHFFSDALHHSVVAGKAMKPADLYQALDLYGTHHLPIHVSEITIPTLPNTPEGLETQAKLTRNFYRLWFSHPAVESIIWWNVADGTAVAGEDKWRGGFLDESLQPKPSYHTLNTLLNQEWKTNFKATVSNKTHVFKGFYGDYVVKVTRQGKTTEHPFSIQRDSPNQLAISFN